MEQGGAVRELYGRVSPFIRALPFLLLLPAATQFDQSMTEVHLGMYQAGGFAAAIVAPRRFGLGFVKLVAMFGTTLIAVRWWAFGGDLGRALRPTADFFRGLAIVLLIDLSGEFAVIFIGSNLGALVDPVGSLTLRLAARSVPLIVWLFFLTALIPWLVAMIVEDRDLTARQSLRASRGRLVGSFAILVAGVLPGMIIHYLLGYGAREQPDELVWGLMVVDAFLMGVVTVIIASTWYTLYHRATVRLGLPPVRSAPTVVGSAG